RYPEDHEDVTSDLLFTRKSIDNNSGASPLSASYPRLGIASSDDWLKYEYRVSWNLKGTNYSIKDPASESQWRQASTSGVNLIPPLSRKKIAVEVDPSAFADST